MNIINVVCFSFIFSIFYSVMALAGEADVLKVKVRYNGGESYQIITTVKHADTGWNHYANAWEVLDEAGNVIGKRTLYHPHEKEQPFTRSLTLDIKKGIKVITVRALDSVHGEGGEVVKIALPDRS